MANALDEVELGDYSGIKLVPIPEYYESLAYYM